MNKNRYIDTIIALLFAMWLIGVILSSCNRTTKSAVITHDTIFVNKYNTDTIISQHNAQDTLILTKYDTIHDYHIYRDSIILKDSVYMREKNDTMFIYKERWNTTYKTKHDTIYRAKTDTISKVKTDTIYIYRSKAESDSAYISLEKQSEKVKQAKQPWASILISFFLLFSLCILVYRYFFKK
jgi:hypothetical protein